MKENRGSVPGPDFEMRGGHPDPKIIGGGWAPPLDMPLGVG